MINMGEIRQKYPQYDDMSDQQLADSLYNKHYSDMDKNEYYSKIGLNKQNWMQKAQNTWYGGAGTSLANQALDLAAMPTQAFQGAAGLLNRSLNSILGTNLQIPNITSTPQIPQPEDPSYGYGVGHALGTAAGYAPIAWSGAQVIGRKVVPAVGRTISRALKANPAEIASKLEYMAGSKNAAKVASPAIGRYQDIEAAAEASPIPFYTKGRQEQAMVKRELQKSKLWKGKETKDYEKFIDIPTNELEKIGRGYGAQGMESFHDAFMQKPSYKTAQEYQSALGKKIGYLQKKGAGIGLAPGEEKVLKSTVKGRNALKSEIGDYLDRLGPAYKKMYAEANDIYSSAVKPLEKISRKINTAFDSGGVDAKKLHEILKDATSKEALRKTTVPKDIIDLKDTLGAALRRKKIVKNIAKFGGFGAGSSLGLTGAYKLGHLFSE